MLLRTSSAPILLSSDSSSDLGFYKHSRSKSHSSTASFHIDDHNPIARRRDRNPNVPKSTRKQGRVQVVEMVIGGGNTGGGRGSEGGNGSNYSDHDHGYGHDDMDKYYQNLIEANPGNTLLLGNYANFLKEVRGDYDKAEEYCERAILENNIECDANILCIYAELIWKIKRDADRAQFYFIRAVNTAPSDCYVLASYARFLWDVDEDELDDQHNDDFTGKLFKGCNSDHPVPIPAPS